MHQRNMYLPFLADPHPNKLIFFTFSPSFLEPSYNNLFVVVRFNFSELWQQSLRWHIERLREEKNESKFGQSRRMYFSSFIWKKDTFIFARGPNFS